MADADAAKAAFEKIVGALDHQGLVAHIDVVSTTLLIYEIIANFCVEIRHVWMRNWSASSVLYLIQRYLPLFDTAFLIIHHQFGKNLSTRYCTLNYNIGGWCYIVGIVLSEVVLTFRVWAVWKRSIPVGIGLIVFFLACWVPSYVLFAEFLKAMEFATLPFPSFRGCFIAGGSHILYLCWVLMMVYDTGTLVMILIPGVAAYRRGGRSELVNTIYRDGVFYYALIFLISLINVIVILILPSDLVHVLNSFERVLHSVLTSRAILHIRQVASQHYTGQTSTYEIGEMSFPIVSNGVHDRYGMVNCDVTTVGSKSL